MKSEGLYVIYISSPYCNLGKLKTTVLCHEFNLIIFYELHDWEQVLKLSAASAVF